MKILGADPIVFSTLKKVCISCFVETVFLCLSVSAVGVFISILSHRSRGRLLFEWIWIAVSFAAVIAYGIIGRRRKRDFDRCLADINETLREDVIVQVHRNPVGGMYENDSYTVMKKKGDQTEALCGSLIKVSYGAVRIIGAVVAAACMFLMNPIASVPVLALVYQRTSKVYRLQNRYDQALEILDSKIAEYNEKCDTLIASSETMEPDDIALNRAKAIASVDEEQAVCISIRNRLFYHTNISAGLIVLLFGVLSTVINSSGFFRWYPGALIFPSMLMLVLLIYDTSDYYGFTVSLADAEWNSIDLTTLEEE